MRKRVYKALASVTVTFDGELSPVNLVADDVLEITGNITVTDGRMQLISDTDPIPDAICRVDRTVRAYRRELHG
jgi:hypothetical protein